MTEIRHDLTNECVRLSEAAVAARRAAWRWDGGFVALLGSMLAAGALFGVLAMAGIQGRGDAREFGKFPRFYCGAAGGWITEQDDGSSYCWVWIKKPAQ